MTDIDLGYREVSRSAYASGTGRPLDVYLGMCASHDRPVRHEGQPQGFTGHPGRYYVPCPEGDHLIEADRLVAVTTHVTCDGACMSARRPSCDCGCGGMNHGKSWGTTATRQEFESALLTYRAEKARIEAKRDQRREAAARRERASFEAWAQQHAGLVASLAKHMPDELGYPQPGFSDFLADLARQVSRGKALTDNQVAAAERSIARQRARQAELATREAAKRPVPVGKVRLTGKIVKITSREGYMPGSVELKATVSCEGYAVWVTLPRVVEDWARENRGDEIWSDWKPSYQNDYHGASERWTRALRGVQLSFSADVTCSDRDESFGFCKRPTKVEFSTPEPEMEASS